MDTCCVVHHWLIDSSPTKSLYHARCKNCGLEKDFPQEQFRFRLRAPEKPAAPPAPEPSH